MKNCGFEDQIIFYLWLFMLQTGNVNQIFDQGNREQSDFIEFKGVNVTTPKGDLLIKGIISPFSHISQNNHYQPHKYFPSLLPYFPAFRSELKSESQNEHPYPGSKCEREIFALQNPFGNLAASDRHYFSASLGIVGQWRVLCSLEGLFTLVNPQGLDYISPYRKGFGEKPCF